ncbi:hypothetical protein GH742_02355 [Legionella sp. MW5194]|uniref:hypothetical protein n=1 Tax=Legionella sp. MW5194 TaxID=2662448 RepID=UPI00193C9389|nr:hypothetical protein [Legionella sp. MW5194]QRN02805.1 hypothetical protein GH742_02355 [Legionella sp. MW5194]
MNTKKGVSIVLLVGSMIHLSFAFTPIHPVKVKSNTSDVAVGQSRQTTFIDFSGTWKGKCTFNDYETEETVIIKNTAEYIKFGNKLFIVGDSLYSESNTRPQVTYFDHKQLQWSNDGNSLIIHGTKVVGARLDTPLSTYLFTDRMSLVEDQIVISITVKGFQNMKLIMEDNGHCLLDRV